jgi:hypothetical protein
MASNGLGSAAAPPSAMVLVGSFASPFSSSRRNRMLIVLLLSVENSDLHELRVTQAARASQSGVSEQRCR